MIKFFAVKQGQPTVSSGTQPLPMLKKMQQYAIKHVLSQFRCGKGKFVNYFENFGDFILVLFLNLLCLHGLRKKDYYLSIHRNIIFSLVVSGLIPQSVTLRDERCAFFIDHRQKPPTTLLPFNFNLSSFNFQLITLTLHP